MKVATGRVVEGKVVLEGEPLAEGAVVTVVARDDGQATDHGDVADGVAALADEVPVRAAEDLDHMETVATFRRPR